MTTPHNHAALIKQWADNSELIIQWKAAYGKPDWIDCNPAYMLWNENIEYRIKPEPKPDYSVTWSWRRRTAMIAAAVSGSDDVKFTWDGETGVLKSVEIVK
jgi:hypothetical protein